MSIAIAITNHNQHKLINNTIKQLLSFRVKHTKIFVLSDGKPFNSNNENVIAINNDSKGRCNNRNSVIPYFLSTNIDYLIFIDGDCSIESNIFLIKYQNLLKKYDLVFGTRIHSDVTGLEKPPSDLLTANMDNLYLNKPLDYRDLRIVSNAFDTWNKSKEFSEKLDLLLTGMISWSCNFGITRKGLIKLLKFEECNFNNNGLFDNSCFKDKWGYEDVAMGIDALYANLNIGVSDDIQVIHKSHNRTDGLFDHIKGRHLIMTRYRNIESNKRFKNSIYLAMILATIFYTAGLITGLITEYVTIFKTLGFVN